ncbi:hypothetical protein [Calothrix sp. NIES-2098]|uniref:hypothetical protein n=1 Tax=Calothrix sp. NIES-2098 TaxID=1954171 RepID=UPI0030D7348A
MSQITTLRLKLRPCALEVKVRSHHPPDYPTAPSLQWQMTLESNSSHESIVNNA